MLCAIVLSWQIILIRFQTLNIYAILPSLPLDYIVAFDGELVLIVGIIDLLNLFVNAERSSELSGAFRGALLLCQQ